MTQTEKQELLSKLGAEQGQLETRLQMLENERRALEATPVTSYKVWEPAEGVHYWDAALLMDYKYYNDQGAHKRSTLTGTAHPTKEAAERHHSFLVMLHDLHKFAVEHNEGWKPDWDDASSIKWIITFDEKFDFEWEVHRRRSTLPSFKSKELAQKAIDTFGDRLKILFEYYNS